MSQVIDFFLYMFKNIVLLLDSVNFEMMGVYISWFDLMISFSSLCIVVAVFWKGVRK